MENGYALVPAATLAVTPVVEGPVRVKLPLDGDYSCYVAVEGEEARAVLADLALTYGAETHVGVPVPTVRLHMPTRLEPPQAFVAFAMVTVDSQQYDRVAREAAGDPQTIGMAGSRDGNRLLIEYSGSDAPSAEKPHQRLLAACGDAIRSSSLGVGEVSAGTWRDA